LASTKANARRWFTKPIFQLSGLHVLTEDLQLRSFGAPALAHSWPILLARNSNTLSRLRVNEDCQCKSGPIILRQ
jgi:hypothetical protein